MAKIKAIVFDYFGVIGSDEYWDFVKADKNLGGDFQNLAQAVNQGTLHWRDFLEEIAQRTNRPLEDVIRLYDSERINPAVVAYIDQLHGSYKTGLLTNAHHEFLEPRLEKAQLYDYFDAVIISSRVGVTRPNPEIYQMMLKALKVRPEQAIMIDDGYMNGEGARAVDMHVIQYRDLPTLKIELQKLINA